MAETRYAYKRIKTGWSCTATVILSCECTLTVVASSWDKTLALFECKKLIKPASDKHRC